MQMFKKSVALVLSILMLLSMLAVAAGMSAFAAESYKVTAKSTQGYFTDLDKTYKAGDEFDLKVYLTADQLITDGQIDVEFNSNALYVTSVTTGEKLSSKVRPTINKTDKVQTTQNLISINFSCPVDPETGVDAADYKTEGLFFTVHFQVKNEIAADQVISFNIKALSGTTDVMKYSAGFAYVNNSTVQTTGASLRAQLGDDLQPTTDPVTSAPPTTAPPTTAPPTTAPPTTVPPTTAPPTTQVSTTEAQETTAPVSTYTTKFTNNKGWNDVYLYAWSSTGGEMAAWPGTKLTEKSQNGLGEEQYTATFDSKYDKIIFSNGSTEQTVDITFDPSVTGYYPTQKTNNKWEVGTWTDQPATSPQPTTEANETTQPQGTTSAPEGTTSASDGIVVTAKSAQNLFADVTKTYKAGDEFDLKVYLTADQLITDGQIDVKFDSNALFVSQVTTGGKLAEKVNPVINKTEKVQTNKNLISINFSCPVDPETGVDAADYKNEGLFFTIHFQIKPNVTDDQIVNFDSKALTGTTDVMKYSAAFPYVNNSEVQTAGATLRAELDGSTTPEGTTAASEGTTAAPEGTTATPEPEMYTFYYLPSAEQENAGNKYKLNFNDPNGVAPENWHQYDFVKTPITVDGVNIYSVSVPKDFDDVTTLQYQVYNTANEWVSQNEFAPAKLSNFDNQVVKADGTIDVKPTEPATEGTTAAPEDTTAAPTVEPTTTPEGTTATPTVEPTTTPEGTTATPTVEPTTTPEPTTVAPTVEPTTAVPTVEPTTAVPTVEPTTATPTVKPTEAPTLAPSKVDFNKNPDEKSAVNAIAKAKSDGDPKGSVFNKLKAKVAKTTKNSNKITWNKVTGAKKYIVMGNKCGKAANGKFNAFKKIKTTTGKSFTQKKLKKGTYYKYLVLAVNAKGKVISASKVIHVATKGGKVTNYKSLKLNKTSKTLKKGKTFKLKVTKKTKMNKKGTVKNHRKIKFESANTKIATVNAKGKIKAKKKGTTYVYAYAQNGVFKRIKIKVK